MSWIFLLPVLLIVCRAQQGVPAVGSEYNDRSPDGSYRFGFQTGDVGGHYEAVVASKDNTVAGRFGSRDPAKGQVVETQFTSGKRGYRPRGPNVARKYDLSQNKIPYNPPVNPNSPNYNPTLDGYHDPNEDPSYSFETRTPTYTKKEAADSQGHVNGLYSFVDDVGERHDVSYEAGAKIGFNVKTPFPDSKAFTGTFYRGPPSKSGGKTVRGKTSIQQRNDGSYRFVSAGPDQRRTEVSDATGHRRGSYTYIDDKGQQRTVEYIAGPNIGYRIVNKGLGVKFPTAAPFIPQRYPDFPSGFDASFPTEFPPFSLDSNSNSGIGGGGGSSTLIGGISGSGGSGTSTPSGANADDLFGDLFGGSGVGGSGGGVNSGGTGGTGSSGGGFSNQGGLGSSGSGNQGGLGTGSGGSNQGSSGGTNGFLGGSAQSSGFGGKPGGGGQSSGSSSGGNSGGFGSGGNNQGFGSTSFGGNSGGFGGNQGNLGGSQGDVFGGGQSGFGGNQGGFGGSQRPNVPSGFGGSSGGSQGNNRPGSGNANSFGNNQGSYNAGNSGFSGGGFGNAQNSGFGGGNDLNFGGGSTSERPGSSQGFSSSFPSSGFPSSTTTSRPSTTSGYSPPSSTLEPFAGYPDGRPPAGSSTLSIPRPSYFPPTTTATSSSSYLGPDNLGSAFPEDDPNRPLRPLRPSLEDDFLQNTFGDLPKKFFNHPSYFKPKPRPGQKNEPDRDDSTFLSSDKRFFSFPTGISVRAHVQSVDILPFGSRIPSPGFALEHSIRTHSSSK